MVMHSGSSYEMYDLGGNRIRAAYGLGTITTDLVLQGVGNFGGPARADGMFRSTNSASFYDCFALISFSGPTTLQALCCAMASSVVMAITKSSISELAEFVTQPL